MDKASRTELVSLHDDMQSEFILKNEFYELQSTINANYE